MPVFNDLDSGAAIGGKITGGTAGSVLFVGTGGIFAQDNANLFWDDTNNRLGIGTTSPQAALHVGTLTHTSGAAGDVAIDGRLLVTGGLTSVNYTAGRVVDIRGLPTTTSISLFNYGPSLAAAATASGTFVALNIQPTGTPTATSGSYTSIVTRILATGQPAGTGVTVNDYVSFAFQVSPSESTGKITALTGADYNLQGTNQPFGVLTSATTDGTDVLVVTSTTGIEVGMWIQPGAMTTIPAQTTVLSVDSATTLTMSNTSTGTEGPSSVSFQPIGTVIRGQRMRLSARQKAVANLYGITFETISTTTAYVANVALIHVASADIGVAIGGQTNTWSLIQNDKTVSGTNFAWNFNITGTNPSRHAGKLTIGDTASPTAKLLLGAGSASVFGAPMKTQTGPLLSSPEDGAWEHLTDKIYFTIPTGTARKEIALNDIALTSGRMIYATTNGRHTDSANITTDGTIITAAFSGAHNGTVGATTPAAGIFTSLQADTITNDTGLAAGTYTPTRSAEANMDANVTMTEAQYLRVGNTITVSGRFTADPTLTATATSFEMTLPIASNVGAAEDVAGTAFCGAIAGMGAAITGSVANDTAVISWIASDITSQTWSYDFTYQVI